jgi:hypothetical protein
MVPVELLPELVVAPEPDPVLEPVEEPADLLLAIWSMLFNR